MKNVASPSDSEQSPLIDRFCAPADTHVEADIGDLKYLKKGVAMVSRCVTWNDYACKLDNLHCVTTRSCIP